MNTCENCERAATQMWWPRFTAACYGCAAREIAQGRPFWETRQSRAITPEYRAQLEANWPQDTRAGHKRVQEAWHALRQPRLIT